MSRRGAVVVPRRLVSHHLQPRALRDDPRLAEEMASWTPTSGSEGSGSEDASGGEAMVSPALIHEAATLRRAPAATPAAAFAKETLTPSVAQSLLRAALDGDHAAMSPRPARRWSSGNGAAAGRVWHSTQCLAGASTRDVIRGVVRLCNMLGSGFVLLSGIAMPADASMSGAGPTATAGNAVPPPQQEQLDSSMRGVPSSDSLDAMPEEDAITVAAAAAHRVLPPAYDPPLRDGLARVPNVRRPGGGPGATPPPLTTTDLAAEADAGASGASAATGSASPTPGLQPPQPQPPSSAADASLFELCPADDEDLALALPEPLEDAGESRLVLRLRADAYTRLCTESAIRGEAAPPRTVLELRLDTKPAVRAADGAVLRRRMLVVRFRRPRLQTPAGSGTLQLDSGADSSSTGGGHGYGRADVAAPSPPTAGSSSGATTSESDAGGGGGGTRDKTSSSPADTAAGWAWPTPGARPAQTSHRRRHRPHAVSRSGGGGGTAARRGSADPDSDDGGGEGEPNFLAWLEGYEREMASKAAAEGAAPTAFAALPPSAVSDIGGQGGQQPAPPPTAAATPGAAARGGDGGWLKRLQVRFASPAAARRRGSREGATSLRTNASGAAADADAQYDGDAEGGAAAASSARRGAAAAASPAVRRTPGFVRALLSPTAFRATPQHKRQQPQPQQRSPAPPPPQQQQSSSVTPTPIAAEGGAGSIDRGTEPSGGGESLSAAASTATLPALVDATSSVTNTVRRAWLAMRAGGTAQRETGAPPGSTPLSAAVQRPSIFSAFTTPLFLRAGAGGSGAVDGAERPIGAGVAGAATERDGTIVDATLGQPPPGVQGGAQQGSAALSSGARSLALS